MGTLVAGPWIGEFGWECAVWAPVVHAAHDPRGRTVVYGPPGHAGLYPFAAAYIETNPPPGNPDCWKRGKYKPQPPHTGAMACTRLVPDKRSCLRLPRKPVHYGPAYPRRDRLQVAIHARNLSRNRSGNRNWGTRNWTKFAERLFVAMGRELDIYWIGSMTGADAPAECQRRSWSRDYRGQRLDDLIHLLRNSHVCVGTSSGPMHLASVVGCPHVVITSNEYRKVIKGTNRDRYERLWNPQHTPVTVVDEYGWRPPVDVVVRATLKMIQREAR